MAAVSSKARKQHVKPPKSRLLATSSLAQPVAEDAWATNLLSSFSPDAGHFALVSLAVDKHRLRVYNANTSRAIAELTLEGARITTLLWIAFDHSDEPNPGGPVPKKKRKKAKKSAADSSKASDGHVQAVVLGLSDGSVQVFSVIHGGVLRTLSPPSSTAAITALAPAGKDGTSQLLWVSSADGALRLWDLRRNQVILSSNDKRTPYSAMAVRPHVDEDGRSHVLAASNEIQLLSIDTPSSQSASDLSSTSLEEICLFTGHASSVNSLQWDESSHPSKRFFSSAEGDRFVNVWDCANLTTKRGKLAASCPLDSNVRDMSVCAVSGKQVLLALSTSGRIFIAPVPAELSTSSGSNSSKSQVPTLLPRTTITVSKKKSPAGVNVVAASFVPKEPGQVRVATLVGGVKVGFEDVQYCDGSGEFIPEVVVEAKATLIGASDDVNGISTANVRYAEPSKLAISSGEHMTAPDQNGSADVDNALDIDLAELSLGQRLTVRSGNVPSEALRSSGSDQEQDSHPDHAKSKRRKKQGVTQPAIPANSLTRTLIQALHSSDSNLLESCLNHSDPKLVKNTVQRLPPQLIVPLLSELVDRLGRGGRGAAQKGRGGGASSQRGMGLIVWVKAVLTMHSGYLLTMPDLVARLSNLHATLTSRLILQEQLLSLNGRLDLVLTQIELRSSTGPAPLTVRAKGGKNAADAKKEPQKYVEGESSEDEDHMEVEEEDGDDDGSVEDIELGGGETDDSDESQEGEGDDESASEEEENVVNGFIDDEAEEDYDEDDSDDSE